MSSKKHEQNRKKKQRKLANHGAIRSPSGEMIMPTDPRWVKLAKEQAAERKKREVLWGRKRKPPPKPQELEAPAWLARIQKQLAYASVVDPEHLVYKGRSKRTGTKAGKNKVITHHFLIEPPIPHPFEDEPTTFLWHGSPLNNASGILSRGLRASSYGMLGPGVYLGTLAKAKNYVHGATWNHAGYAWGLLLYCEAALGKVVTTEPEAIHKRADTLHCARGTYGKAWGKRIKREEWCVRDPHRVVVREIHLMPRVK